MGNRRFSGSLATSQLVAVLLGTSCQMSDVQSDLALTRTSQYLIGDNGVRFNGLVFNGLGLNGLGLNGLGLNGLGLNGLGLNGVGSDIGVAFGGGLYLTGLNGIYLNRINASGVDHHGLGVNDIAHAGGRNGLIADGIGLANADAIGSDGNGNHEHLFAGLSVNGFYLRGLRSGALVWQGAELREVPLSGLRIGGTDGLQIISTGGVGAVDVSPAREASLEVVFQHLVGCALPDGASVTITSSDGVDNVYHGLRGFAPEWADGALSEQGEANVRTCVASSPVAVEGVALNLDQEVTALDVLWYMTSCALTPDQEAIIYDGLGEPHHYRGIFGLAPEWHDSALSEGGKRRVSACIAARVNGNDQTVAVSLRSDTVASTAVEIDLFSTHEGAFWGQLFGDEVLLFACTVDGGGMSGRICTESDICSFTTRGACADVCTSYDPITGFSDCDGTSDVVNVFLKLGREQEFGNGTGCRIRAQDGQLFCWGSNHRGQACQGHSEDVVEDPAPVVDVEGRVVEAHVEGHGCARTRAGRLYCWGRNDFGQVGDGGTEDRLHAYEVPEVSGDVIQLGRGRSHTCVVTSDGAAWCWGWRLDESGNDIAVTRPAQVPVLHNHVARLSSSTLADHQCAVTDDGRLYCWGHNLQGQLGDGTTDPRHEPVAVIAGPHGPTSDVPAAIPAPDNALAEVTDVCTMRAQTCARTSDGRMWCWGDGVSEPQEVPSSAPVAVRGLACGSAHVCALLEDGTVWCKGDNRRGQLGTGASGRASSVLVQAVGVSDIRVISGEATHTCAERADDALLCWGDNSTMTLTATPTPVSLGLPALP